MLLFVVAVIVLCLWGGRCWYVLFLFCFLFWVVLAGGVAVVVVVVAAAAAAVVDDDEDDPSAGLQPAYPRALVLTQTGWDSY